jgi:phosphate transport system substrate-binding protein
MLVGLSVEARIQIRHTGSSSSYLFTQKVADEFSKKSTHVCPLVESTNTNKGFIDLAQTEDQYNYDVINASRQIQPAELEQCKKAGIGPLLEVCVGLDAIALIAKKTTVEFNLSIHDISKAVAKKIKNSKGEFVDNPYKKWSDINPKLPDLPIRILIPSKNHGTREGFESIVLNENKEIRDGPEVREISAYEASDNYRLFFDFLEKNENVLAFVSTNILDEHSHIKKLPINGVEPTYLNIQNRRYPMVRKVFIYIKEKNYATTEGLQDYVHEWLSPEAIGKDGYLTKMGLIPLLPNENKQRKL